MLCLHLITELEKFCFPVRQSNTFEQEGWEKMYLITSESLQVSVAEKHFRGENTARPEISRF